MHLRSLGHSVENKSDIKGSVFSPWRFSAVASFATQKSVPGSLTDRCHFFFPLFTHSFSGLSLRISQILPLHLEPGPQFLNPLPLHCPSIHKLFFSLFNSLHCGCRFDLGFVLQLPSHFHPHSSLGNVDLFPTSSSRSKASGDHQQSSAKKEKKMCGNSQDGKERRPLIVFSL